MELTMQGKELTLEARIIGALMARVERGVIQSRTVTLDELAAVKGVLIDRLDGFVVPRASLHQPEPERFNLEGEFLKVQDLLVDGKPYDVVMTDGPSGAVWAVPRKI